MRSGFWYSFKCISDYYRTLFDCTDSFENIIHPVEHFLRNGAHDYDGSVLEELMARMTAGVAHYDLNFDVSDLVKKAVINDCCLGHPWLASADIEVVDQ